MSLKSIFQILFSSKKRFLYLANKGLYKNMDDEKYLSKLFYARMGKKLNLINPQTFNEKLQWLKLYDRNPEYSTLVDKYAVKKYVADRIGAEHIIPTLGVWNRFDDINFDELPNQFVLKCTHDSGGLVICSDKSNLDLARAKEKIDRSVAYNYFWHGREWPYKNIKPRIIAEQYMKNADGSDLKDYKFFCFNGEPKLVLVCADRYSEGGLRENFYDMDWNLMPVQRPKHPNTGYAISKPSALSEMVKLAQILAKDKPFSRIDFYEINGKVYFGEITFFPASGMQSFSPDEWDYKLGEWITLPEKTN